MEDMRSGVSSTAALTGMFVLFGPVIASFFPFFSLFLSERGLSPSDIGVVVAAMAVARIAANPVWGNLADARLGRRRVLRVTLAGSIGAALLLSVFGRGLASALVLAALLASVNGSVGPNIDALSLVSIGQEGMANYGRIRSWESLGYAVSCVAFGSLLQGVGVTWLMFVHAASMAALLAWSLTLAFDRPSQRTKHGRLGTVGEAFRVAPRLWGFLAGCLVLWTGFNGAWNFLGLRIESRGGGPWLIGVGAALGGLVEVAVMRWSPRLTRQIGLRSVYLVGGAGYAAAFLLWGLVKSPVLISFLTVFEGFGFSLLFTSGVVIVGQLLPVSLYSTGQSLVSTVAFGLGPIVGGAVGGIVYQRLGARTLYVGASALALAGAAIVWATLSGPAFRRPAVRVAQAEVKPIVGPIIEPVDPFGV